MNNANIVKPYMSTRFQITHLHKKLEVPLKIAQNKLLPSGIIILSVSHLSSIH